MTLIEAEFRIWVWNIFCLLTILEEISFKNFKWNPGTAFRKKKNFSLLNLEYFFENFFFVLEFFQKLFFEWKSEEISNPLKISEWENRLFLKFAKNFSSSPVPASENKKNILTYEKLLNSRILVFNLKVDLFMDFIFSSSMMWHLGFLSIQRICIETQSQRNQPEKESSQPYLNKSTKKKGERVFQNWSNN